MPMTKMRKIRGGAISPSGYPGAGRANVGRFFARREG
jgi:hypothetical protein